MTEDELKSAAAAQYAHHKEYFSRVENDYWGPIGKYLRDMDRGELLQVITGLKSELEAARAGHLRTLNTWDACQKARWR